MFWIKMTYTTVILFRRGLQCSQINGVYTIIRYLFYWMMLMCIRAMLHDEIEYPEPFKFLPERWILKEGQKEPLDPAKVAFGFGRRCVAC